MAREEVPTTRRIRRAMQPVEHSPNSPANASSSTAISDPLEADGCLTLASPTATETQRIGEALGQILEPGDLLLLQGPIGAGKTTFTQGLARGLGLTSRVTSPSFTLANVHEPERPGACPLYHLDLWRIKNPAEALGIGLDEYLSGTGACVIEWPDVAEAVLPGEFLRIRFTPRGEERQIEFCPEGLRPTALLNQLRIAVGVQGGTGAVGD